LTLVGTADGFDLVRHGSPRDTPAMRGLTSEKIVGAVGMLLGGR
jgi:precorrin-3B synthase